MPEVEEVGLAVNDVMDEASPTKNLAFEAVVTFTANLAEKRHRYAAFDGSLFSGARPLVDDSVNPDDAVFAVADGV